MAGIAGIYCADGRPAEVAELRRMTRAVEDRGPDGITYWNSGPVAFAHLQFRTTPESLDERQPLMSPGGEACLVWNGRLDNRDELLDALAAKGARPVDRTDPGLVLSAYLAWGTECLPRLVGDFALALWDARLRRLWCARDYAGLRPFHYYCDGKTFLFAPEVRGLLAHPLVSLKINEGMVGEYLVDAITNKEETLYSDIRRLPPDSSLTIDADGRLRIASWWNPDLSLLEYRTDEEYADHFRQLLDQSVRAQTRCNAPFAVMMSGGLDSPSIAVTAQALLDQAGRNSERVLTFSIAYPGKPWDESEYIKETARHAGLQTQSFQPFNADLEFYRERAGHWRDFPGGPNGEPMSLPITDAARRHGCRVLLDGIGGDELLEGKLEHLMDLAAAGKFLQLRERGRIDWEICGGQWHWSIFVARILLRQFLAQAAPGWMRSRRIRHNILSDAFLRRIHLADRIADILPNHALRHFSSRAQEAVFRRGVHGVGAQIFEWADRELAHAGFESRSPFFDRRLAEFCLRLPESQRQRGTLWKWLLRNAMCGRLPEPVRTREDKAEFSELFDTFLNGPQVNARLKNLAISKHTDWIDPGRFAAQMEAMNNPEFSPVRRHGPTWFTLGIDLWFEGLQSTRSA